MKILKRAAVPTAILVVGLFAASPSRAGEIKGKVAVQGLRSPANIAVYVEAVSGKRFNPPRSPVIMDQKNLHYVPHVLVVLKGTTVDFLNSDPVAHNVYWPSIGGSKKLARNLGTFMQGQKRTFRFDHVGIVPLLCNVHPEMSAYIVVVPTPYFALTDEDGTFEIRGIPPGHYTLKTWSEEGNPVTQAVAVSSGTVNVDLTVKK